MSDPGAPTAETRTIQPIVSGRLRLETSSACQLRCPSCPTTSGHTDAVIGKGLLKLAHFTQLIDDNPWLFEIELSNYGEVFLNPELLGIFQHAYDRNVGLIIRNGANLNHVRADVLEGLVRYEVGILTCSIDGASQESYARYRVRGDFDRVIGNIKRINEFKKAYGSSNPSLVWQFVAFGHNEKEIPLARRLAEELGMTFRLKLSWDAEFSPVKDETTVRDIAGAATRREYEEKFGKDYTANICDQLWKGPQVNWDGKVLGCCLNFWGDFGGNAFKDGLIESLNNEKMRYAREMLSGHVPPRPDIPCSTCDHYMKRIPDNVWVDALSPMPQNAITGTAGEAWKAALSHRERGHTQTAAKWARLVLQLERGHKGALAILGEAADKAGRKTAARYYFERAGIVLGKVERAEISNA